MNSTEFVIWLKGFVAASNNYNLTPSGWETLKSELEKVNDNQTDIGLGAQSLDDYDDGEYNYSPPNEVLLQAAQKYKEWLDQIDKSERPAWYSTITNEIKD